jgi:uncharacterized protein (TIGR02231 family)
MRRHSKHQVSISTTLALLVALPALVAGQALAQPTAVVAKKDRAAPGKLVSAVVYRNRAQVTRQGVGNCAKGIAEFGELPTTLDPKTLRATVAGGKVIGVTYKTEVTGPRGGAKELVAKLRVITTKLQGLNADWQAADAVLSKLSGYKGHMKRIWGYQAGGKKAQTRTWDAALELMRKERVTANSKKQVVRVARRKLYRERRELRRQLNRMRRKQRRETYRAKVLLSACQGRPKVMLSYVVPGATWRVAYQARVDTQARRVTLVAQAIVQQSSGEDWNNIRLSVSTANLQRSNLPPTIGTMRVSTRKPHSKQKVLARRFERRRHLKTSSGKTQAVSRGPAQARKEPGLAMQLRAAGRVTVPADGRGIAVELAKVTRKASYAYETVPKLFPFVYHRVRLDNPFSFPMLPGPLAIYRDGGFAARTRVKQRAPGEPITVSLGVDNQLQVHRWTKEEKRYKAGTFGSTQKLKHRYEVQVGNWTKRRRVILIKENIPVSQNKDIKVYLDKQAAKPYKWNKADGIVTYRLVIPPRSKKKITVAYTVELPKNYKVTGYVTAN